MTVENITPASNLIVIDSGVTDYSYVFDAIEISHIKAQVQQTDGNVINLTYTTDYTVVAASDPLVGGTVTLSGAVLTAYDGDNLVIYRVTPPEQTTSLPNQGPYYAETVEAMDDKAMMLQQENEYATDLSLKVNIGQTAPIVEIGADGTTLIYDASGNLVEGPSASSITGAEAAAAAAAASEAAAAASAANAASDESAAAASAAAAAQSAADAAAIVAAGTLITTTSTDKPLLFGEHVFVSSGVAVVEITLPVPTVEVPNYRCEVRNFGVFGTLLKNIGGDVLIDFDGGTVVTNLNGTVYLTPLPTVLAN